MRLSFLMGKNGQKSGLKIIPWEKTDDVGKSKRRLLFIFGKKRNFCEKTSGMIGKGKVVFWKDRRKQTVSGKEDTAFFVLEKFGGEREEQKREKRQKLEETGSAEGKNGQESGLKIIPWEKTDDVEKLKRRLLFIFGKKRASVKKSAGWGGKEKLFFGRDRRKGTTVF